MNIDIKNSSKPIKYIDAIRFLEDRIIKVYKKESNELIWILEHPSTFTAGTSSNYKEIIDKKIKIIKTSRGGKITWHGPGQIVCYFVIDLSKRKKDIRKFINLIEKTIIDTLKKYKINSFADRKNIGIWVRSDNKLKKIAAIGIKVKKWIAYHGFALNVKNSLYAYKKIIPCGIYNKEVANLKSIKNQNYNKIKKDIVFNLIENLKKKVP